MPDLPNAAAHVEGSARAERTHDRIGWAMIAGGLLAALGAVLVRDEAAAAGLVAAGALMLVATGVLFFGGPFVGAARRPSALRIALLFLMAVGGLVLQVIVSPWVGLGVAQVSIVILLLSGARWPPQEWQEYAAADRSARMPMGGFVAAVGTLPTFFALCGAAVAATDTPAGQFAIAAPGFALLVWLWIRIFAAYGVGPARGPRFD